jgi:glyoxylase-like metal-dependent hydrolase (beta-lactamase superfamily II)
MAGIGLLAALPAFGMDARSPAQSPIRSQHLADGVVLLTGAGCNVLGVRGSEGAVLVDTGRAERIDELLRVLAAASQERPVAAVNTHWHHENTGGNATLTAAGVRVHAHENTKLWMDTSFVIPGTTRRIERRSAAMLPTNTFLESATIGQGEARLELGHLPQAHTDGDVFVRLPGPDIIAVGDLVAVGTYPVLDFTTGGWIGGLVQATAVLLDMAGPGTRVVPSQGDVVGREHLVDQHRMLTTVYERLLGLLKKGMSAREMLAADVTRGFDERWGDPERFVLDAYPGLWGHQNEFDGIT